MKPQTKIDILVTVETGVICSAALTISVLSLMGSAIAFLLISGAGVASFFTALYIKKRVLKMTWREVWASETGGKEE